MKLFLLLFLLPVTIAGCLPGTKEDFINTTIPEKKIKEDFYLLERIVQEAHAGVYAYNTPEEITHLFDSINNTIDGALTARAFYNKINTALDRLGCIHTDAYLPGDLYDSLDNRPLFFPVPLMVIGNKVYINSKAYSIPLGSEVLSLNDKTATELVQALGVYKHTDGHSNGIRSLSINNDFALDYYMAYGGREKFLLSYYNSETKKIESVNVKAEKLKDINANAYADTWYFFATDAPYDLEIDDGNSMATLTIRTFSYRTYASSQAFLHFLDNGFRLIQQNGIRNLVIDCRNNDGGQYSNTYPLLCYLLNKPIHEYDSTYRRFDRLPYPSAVSAEDTGRLTDEDSVRKHFTKVRPGIFMENSDQVTEWQPNDVVFKGRLFVITNNRVASAASNFVAILKDRTNAFIVGEETAGNYLAHNACIFTYELPNSHITVDIPTQRFFQPVSKRAEPGGVWPHKIIPVTLQDVLDYKDAPYDYIRDSMIKK